MENNELKTKTLVKALRLIRTSNILSIISILAAAIGGITMITSIILGAGDTMETGADIPLETAVTSLGVAGIGGLIAIIGGIITIIAGILGIVALVRAGGSHSGYKTALLFVMAGIVLNAITIFLPTTGTIDNILAILSIAVNFMVAYFVITSTVSLLRNKGNQAVADRGVSVRKLYMICTGVIMICQILIICPFLTSLAAIMSIVLGASYIIQLVAIFKYLSFLGQSATALES